jgi:hypothetical protein
LTVARAQKLKVFRTPIGFHDAYVAAASKKAALEAWGADSNLFASGSAELVDDPDLMREPLANPGVVVRRLRGTLAEHVAALPKTAAGAGMRGGAPRPGPAASGQSAGERTPKPKPRPSRTTVDRAETALAELERRQADARAGLAQRQAELDRERRTLEARQDRERAKLIDRLDTAREKYEEEMRAWRAD